MPSTDSFPRELLVQPPEVRMGYFAAKVVAHPRLAAAHQAVRDALRQPAGASLIFVHGPTGVGKTTLRLRLLEQQLLAEALPDLEQDPGRVPVMAVEAVAPESGQFNWKDYYMRALAALDEPLMAHKITLATPENPSSENASPDGLVPMRPVLKHTASAAEFRWVLEECLRRWRVAVCLIDEAQHLKRLTSGRRLLDQMDTLKSLAALTGTVHVLVGTYELLGMTNLSAQLSRRSVEIHFGRYRADSAEDRLAFKSVVLTFQRHLPLAEEPDLVGCWEALYEGSLGCVGVLESWLNRGDRQTAGPPRFLGNPSAYMPCSQTPAGPPRQAISALQCCLPPLLRRRLPQQGCFGAQSHGLHTRCLRFVTMVAHGHARLASGCWPSFAGRGWFTRWVPAQGFRFLPSHPPCPGFAWRTTIDPWDDPPEVR